MADQKISQLTTIVTVDNATDLFPIVDTSVGETKKITPTALKTALALNNVDNTTDLNKPVSTATQTALNAKQDTLVSATNIKTVNSTSLLGSGNIVVGATPSGVAGAIQFSNGTAFSSDAANLSYDDTNNRLGVGTNVPTARLQVKGLGTTSSTTSFSIQNSSGQELANFRDDIFSSIYGTFRVLDSAGNNGMIMYGDGLSGTKTLWVNGNIGVGALGNNASAKLQIDSTTQGVLFPRMTTTEKNAIATPSAGLVVYDTTLKKLCVRTHSSWETITSS